MYFMKKKKQTAKHVKTFIITIKTYLLNLSVNSVFVLIINTNTLILKTDLVLRALFKNS